jgi:Tetratricopeptide repeat
MRIGAGGAIALAASVWSALAPATAHAQSERLPPPVQEQQRPAQGLRESERARSAQHSAEELQPLEPGRIVTYDDVLKNPDDVELNYLFAQSQVAAGDVRGAASTLERILLIAPDLARVRLLYAVVLYRLDNLDEAEREFHAVQKLPMSDRLRAEVDFYLEQIALRRKTTRYLATVGGGMQFDSNRNAGPANDRVLFLDTPLRLVEGKKKSDWSGVMLAGLHATHDLGFDAGHQLLGGVQIYGQKQIDQTDLDLMAIAGEAGGLYRSQLADVQPSLFASYLNLGGESYVSTIGTGFRADHRVSATLDVFTRFRFDYEFFDKLDESPTTDDRTGLRVQGGIGATWTPRPSLRFDAGVGLLHKEAREDFYTYSGPVALLSGTWLLGRGQFLLSGFTFESDAYDGPERIVSHRTRRDEIYLGGLTYGAPLGFLLPFLEPPRAVRDTLFTVNATYLNEQSSIDNYQYDDWRFTVLLTKNFEF